MRWRVAVSGFFLGVLVAFGVWALQWSLQARRQVTYAMPGKVSTLTLFEGPRITTAEQRAAAARELHTFVAEHGYALVVASLGDGYPQLLVDDPRGKLPWFATARSGAGSGDAFLLDGTYSAHLWRRGLRTPLLPAGVGIAGVIAPPSGSGNLQYVRPLGSVPLGSVPLGAVPLPPGDYVIDTVDPGVLREVAAIVAEAGLEVQAGQRLPLVQYLRHDPLMGITVGFLTFGYFSATLYWAVLCGGRGREFTIRRRCGARTADLAGQLYLRVGPSLAAGVLLGAAASLGVVVLVGQQAPQPGEAVTLLVGGGLGVVLTSVVWLACSAAVLRFLPEAGRVA